MAALIPGLGLGGLAKGAAAAPMVTTPVASTSAVAAAGPTLGAIESSLLGSSLAALGPEVLKVLFGQGGAFRSPAGGTTTGTAGKFTITAQDVLALEQFVDRINFRRPFGPKLDANEILNDTAKRLNEQLNQSTRREMELARVKGELAALPNLMTSIGQIGTAQSQLAQAGLSKVLESALPASYLGNLAASYTINK